MADNEERWPFSPPKSRISNVDVCILKGNTRVELVELLAKQQFLVLRKERRRS